MESGFEIVKWDRNFALYENGNLVCVTVYKRGATEVKRRIEELKAQLEIAHFSFTAFDSLPQRCIYQLSPPFRFCFLTF